MLTGRASGWVLLGGVFVAVSGGCLDAPNRVDQRPKQAGAGQGGGGGRAGSGTLGGMGASSGMSGGAGIDRSNGGTGGGRAGRGGTNGGGAVAGRGGSAVGTGGDSVGGGGDEAGGHSGEAGSDGLAGASPSTGGSAGSVTAGCGGTAGTGGTGGLGQAGAGAEAGTGGEIEEPFEGPCPTSAVTGWVTVAGLEFDPATASAPTQEVVVTDAPSLLTYAASPDPYVIRISGTIAAPAVDVTSNKIIVGDDATATLQGGLRVLGTSTDPAGMVSNVVIRNLHIDATTADTSTLQDEDDGILLSYAHHVWIDHVDIANAPGDDLAVSNGSDYVTVSWSKFSQLTNSRRTGARLGHSDANAAEDAGRLKVTFHHNFWTDSLDQRMPRVRFGDVHVFNDYYSNRSADWPNDTYCIAAGYEARVLVENDFFDEANNPHVFFSFSNGVAVFAEPTAEIVATGNTYIGEADLSAGKLSGQGPAFVPPYAYTLDAPDGVLRNTIRHCAGVPTP